MITLFDLLVVAAILGFAYRGWIAGLEAASIEALELLACLSVAVLAHEALAGFLHAGVTLALGDGVSVSWSVLLAFSLLAWGSFACIRPAGKLRWGVLSSQRVGRWDAATPRRREAATR